MLGFFLISGFADSNSFGSYQEISLSGGRFQNCLREIRQRARDVENKEKGIHIRKEDWEKLHVHIASYNNFPTAAGLASSAAGFACLGTFPKWSSTVLCHVNLSLSLSLTLLLTLYVYFPHGFS